jgi:drug/metabolite transporter (DMT)-like permease
VRWNRIGARRKSGQMKRKKAQNIYLGIGLILLSTLSFTLMSAIIRWLGNRVPLGEVVFARSFFALVPLFLMLLWRRELRLAVQFNNPWGHVGRAIASIGSMFCNFAALARIPLVDATAIAFATPLLNVALAAIFLGEKVRKFRWIAVFVGFVGVLIMLSPNFTTASRQEAALAGSLFAVAGVILTSAAMTQVRQMSKTETTASMVFSFTALSTLASFVTIPDWIWPAPGDAIALVCSGIFGGIGQITVTESYRHAGAGTVAPFAYTSMIYSLIIGYSLFGEVPQAVVLLGALLVVFAGLFVLYRERKLRIDRTREREAETPTSAAL